MEAQWLEEYASEETDRLAKFKQLKELDLLVMDNSVRESTVGQLRGHTAEEKRKIFDEGGKCGFKERIVGSFSRFTRVDDDFVRKLVQDTAQEPDGKDTIAGFWGFSEIAEPTKKTKNAKPPTPDENAIPIGLKKMKALGFFNVIIEINLANAAWNWHDFKIDQFNALLKKRIDWCQTNCPWSGERSVDESQSALLRKLYQDTKPKVRISVNFRDLPDCMPEEAGRRRVYRVADFLTKLPESYNIFALMFEDSTGKSPPEVVGGWAKAFRKIIDQNESASHLAVHIHERYGFCDASVLQCLIDGADGIWCDVAAEGAFVGQASSCVTLINLIRMGNKNVLQRYNCHYLRHAAIEVTRLTTGADPPKNQIVFGPRVLDLVFEGQVPANGKNGFQLATFFNEKAPIRMSTMADKNTILRRLKSAFGDNEHFTEEIAQQMREQLLLDLREGIKEEYMSDVGLALLYERSGGNITSQMAEAIIKKKDNSDLSKTLLKEVKGKWDGLHHSDKEENLELMEFDYFYDGFMAAFFSSDQCADSVAAFNTMGMNKNGQVEWREFKFFLVWALGEYPGEIASKEQLIDVTFKKGIIPTIWDHLMSSAKRNLLEATQRPVEKAGPLVYALTGTQ